MLSEQTSFSLLFISVVFSRWPVKARIQINDGEDDSGFLLMAWEKGGDII